MQQLALSGRRIRALINQDLRLAISAHDGRRTWESSQSLVPSAVVRHGDETPRTVSLAAAEDVAVSAFDDGTYRGHTVRLADVQGADVALELIFGIDSGTDELMLQVAQIGGADTVVDMEHFYRFEKPVSDGGYVVLPHGSGYLIPADCSDDFPGNAEKNWMVGAGWSLPLFGMVGGNDGMCAIVETWWDSEVKAEHIPGDRSTLDFHWRGSLGKLSYPRRLLLRFAEGMDYVAMAKLYRNHARTQGLVRTLEEKAQQTPVIRRYIQGMLLRWPAWDSEHADQVLADIGRLRGMGFDLNFFFPKWSSAGYAPGRNTATTSDGVWQGHFLRDPVPGGWPALAAFQDAVRARGCVVQGFTSLQTQKPDAPEYDEARWAVGATGERCPWLSTHDAVDRNRRMLDNMETCGLKPDVLYYDGYAAHNAPPEDFSRSHPVTRREVFEAQNACFAEARRRGIMPGAELARFWCMADCDYFFFADWSSDRLTNEPNEGASKPVGEPIPLFQLVFHDCYSAGFSSGGYALYAAGYDWWADWTPRLYELIFCSAPAHNWLPDGHVPVRDWENEKTQRRWTWLKRWSAFYRAIATSEMVSHKFLSPHRKNQRIEFANGVAAEFDTAANVFRVHGVSGFTGEWESANEL